MITPHPNSPLKIRYFTKSSILYHQASQLESFR